MKLFSLLFILGLTTQAQAMTFDDGCGSDKYLCNQTCIPQTASCSDPDFASKILLHPIFDPDYNPPKSRCTPECGPDEYCAPYFAGHYTCFPK